MQWKYFTLIFNQSYKSYWSIREEEQTRKYQILQDLDLMGPSYKDRDLIGGYVDLDVVTIFD
jgi:hypothetical protein